MLNSSNFLKVGIFVKYEWGKFKGATMSSVIQCQKNRTFIYC